MKNTLQLWDRLYDDSFIVRGQGFGQEVFSSWPQYGILGTGISWSNRFVRAPPSGGGSNAPRPALAVLHLDLNGYRHIMGPARSAQKIVFKRYSTVILRILEYGKVDIIPPSRHPFDQNQAPTSLKTPPLPHRLFDLQDSLDKLMLFLPQLSDFVPIRNGFYSFRAQTA